ncbi:MAG: YicC family protein [Gammaproteobacteria bacterium]|nr:YicC family protein [Gammaproteobacteria bacterium]
MLCSMTGFARVEDTCEQGTLCWEVRSVNHRYLDINFRLPEEVRRLEARLRSHLQGQLARGKVDCIFRYRMTEVQTAALELNRPLLDSLVQQICRVNEKLPVSAPVTATDILAWPGMIQAVEGDRESFHAACFSLFEQAVEQLVDMRAAEGRRIEKILQDKCTEVKSIVRDVRVRHPQALASIREKLQQRIEELLESVDQVRLEQELVYLAQKMDIMEELDRLDSHLDEMASIFEVREATGRRLDFLMQEFHREANTLAAKSADVETTQAAVDLKVLIEQMREQVQNVE